MKREVSNRRVLLARICFLAAIPLTLLGLIDPLEGGLALLAALIVYAAGFLIYGRGPDKILWIPFVVASLIGLIVLLFAIFGLDRVGEEGQMPPLIIGLMVYRAAVAVTLVGSVITAIRSFR